MGLVLRFFEGIIFFSENLTEERIAQIKALSQREDIMEILANAIGRRFLIKLNFLPGFVL